MKSPYCLQVSEFTLLQVWTHLIDSYEMWCVLYARDDPNAGVCETLSDNYFTYLHTYLLHGAESFLRS